MGVIINSIAIIIGALIGVQLKKGMSEKLSTHIMQGLALCTAMIGLKGALVDQDTIMMIVAISLGGYLGYLLQLEERIYTFADWIQGRMGQAAEGETTIAEGFVSAVLVFCVGAMAVMGALDAGLKDDHRILITKAIIDGIASIIFASTKGIGVALSAGAILVYEGGIMLMARFIAPYLSEAVVYEMSAIGSLLLVMIGLNLLELTKIKVMNFLPAMFLPILLVPLMAVVK